MMKHVVLQELTSRKKQRIDMPCLIGRSHQADFNVGDRSVSQRHALITRDENQKIWIEDLASSNGVYVNKLRIKQKAPLRSGDTIRLGKTEFLVLLKKEPPVEQTIVLHSLDSRLEWNIDQARLKLLSEITIELAENQDLNVLAKNIFLKLKPIFKQDRGYLAAFREDGSLQSLLSGEGQDPVSISRSILKRLLEAGESFLLEDALGDASFKEQESIIALRIRSALCAPLICHNQIYGVIYMDRNVPGAYRQEDLELLKTVAYMISPLIENARLWSQLNHQYQQAVDRLKETEARLIESERKAATIRLAQAMAHEIRNPLMGIGGMARRLARSGKDELKAERFNTVVELVERVESVLSEVDQFVKLPEPEKALERIDHLIQDVLGAIDWNRGMVSPVPVLCVCTPHVRVPLDAGLFKKAFRLLLDDLRLDISQVPELKISVHYRRDRLEVMVGELHKADCLCELFSPELKNKPWSLGLFLNISQKIISDHQGRILFNTGDSRLPVLIEIPARINLSQ